AVLVALVALAVFWNWDWFIPLVERRASATLGRPVTVAHLHVRPGAATHIVADGVEISNPEGFGPGSRFGTIDHLAVDVDLAGLLHDRSVIRVPLVAFEHPVFDVGVSPSGAPNYTFGVGSSSGGASGRSVRIGTLRIADGHARVLIPKLKADFALDIATREPPAASAPSDREGGQEDQLLVHAKGTYAGQPITGRFIGGSVLSLRDPKRPYPIDLRLENGPTHVAIAGTVQDPLAFKGANISLDLSGPDMAQLYHLTGIPIPETPPYQAKGTLDYAGGRIRFDHFAGRLGRSDIGGDLAVDPRGRGEKPLIEANLESKLVDFTDLGGFIGTTPGPAGKARTPEQQREKMAESKSANLLPDTALNVPKLQAADLELRYRGHRIEGRSIPLDNVVADVTIQNGVMRIHPVSFGVGRGRIAGDIAAVPQGKALGVKADIGFQQVDVSRLMAATHSYRGAGSIGGRAVIDGTGTSIADVLAHSGGELKLFMTGGDLSALLVDLAGLEFAKALLSALGMPERTEVRCMVADLPLRAGLLETRVLLIDTTEANIIGSGTVNLRNETVDFQIKTDPKHISIGSVPAPIDVRGPLKNPSVLPDAKALAARGGAAAALGFLLTPLAALLPTIQLGLGEDTDCNRTIAQVGEQGTLRMRPAEVERRMKGGAAVGRTRR
ncbi:MAG: AsmA family protein, partial [Acetobacteraceae bacterium]|nr:AsmA family protein [Acetobacteraceae bacterium]